MDEQEINKNNEEDDEQKREDSKEAENIDITGLLNGFDNKLEIGSITNRLLWTEDVGESARELCKDLISSSESEEEEECAEIIRVEKQADKKKDVHVKFAEEYNRTKTITPRDDNPVAVVGLSPRAGQQHNSSPPRPKSAARPYSGRSDLRNVRSRTDSGVRLQSSNRKIERKPRKEASQVVNPEEVSNQNGQISPNKSKSAITTISVNYLDDEEELNERLLGRGGRNSQEGLRAAHGSDYESDPDMPSERPGSANKMISHTVNRNYYETLTKEPKPTLLTKKTLELGDGSLIERKTILEIDPHTPHLNTYVVPESNRPKSAVRNRPSSAQPNRPTSAVQHKPAGSQANQHVNKHSSTTTVQPNKYISSQPNRSVNNITEQIRAEKVRFTFC